MDELFFYSSKLIWMLIAPDSLFVILMAFGLILLVFGRIRGATLIFGVLTLGVVLLSLFSVGSWMLYPLESRVQTNPELPQRIDGIIVLGGSVLPLTSQYWGQLETNDFHERLSSFSELAHRYPEARLVFTGGNASLEKGLPSEAKAVRKYLLGSGIEEQRLVLENRARNTAENVTFTRQLVRPEPGENWILITTAYHMPRSIGIFCQQDWPVIPYPVDHKTVPDRMYRLEFNLLGHAVDLNQAIHEWLGLLAYRLSGKTPELIPQGCR
jgi:uncharacterized SAM-binding protein YcdF (DUF218 family)